MYLAHDGKKAVYLVFFVFGSYLISSALFLNLVLLLGAAIFGFFLKGARFTAGVIFLCFAALLLLDARLGFSFSLIYPFVFSGVAVLVLQISKEIKKGDLIFFTTLAVAVLFVAYMLVMEAKFGLFTAAVNQAKEEVVVIGDALKSFMPENDVKEYASFGAKLIDDYFIFLALIQYVFFCFINFYLLPRIFTGIPPNLGEEFSQLKMPFAGVWGVNAGLAVYLFVEGKAAMWGINIALFFLLFYFLQGISLSALFFKRYGVPVYAMVFFYLFFLANQIMWLLISFAGIIDVWFNLKKYLLKEA